MPTVPDDATATGAFVTGCPDALATGATDEARLAPNLHQARSMASAVLPPAIITALTAAGLTAGLERMTVADLAVIAEVRRLQRYG
jgi:hypothetical protein